MSIQFVILGGRTPTMQLNYIDYVTIATTGNAADFGDFDRPQEEVWQGCSDSHGGLG